MRFDPVASDIHLSTNRNAICATSISAAQTASLDQISPPAATWPGFAPAKISTTVPSQAIIGRGQ